MATPKKNERAKNRIPIHLRRVTAELEITSLNPVPSPNKIDIRVVVNDVSPAGAGIYVGTLLHKGQEGTLKFTIPTPISIKGQVVWSQEFNVDSHVLTSKPFQYRAGIKFIFANDEEKKATAQFCKTLVEKV